MATREEVYAKFGLTAEAAQLFETELDTILLAREGEERGWHLQADPEKAAEFYEKLNRKTLGQILASLREYLDLDEEVAASFELALKARNRLNHGFFERHNFAIWADSRRDAMIAELETMHSQLAHAYEIAQPAAMQLVSRIQTARMSPGRKASVRFGWKADVSLLPFGDDIHEERLRFDLPRWSTAVCHRRSAAHSFHRAHRLAGLRRHFAR